MAVLRALASLTFVVGATLVTHGLHWPRYRANLAIPRLAARTERAAAHPDRTVGAIIARETLDEVLRLRNFWPGDIRLEMLAAANARTLGRHEAAIGYYHEALRLDQRPEVYVALADAELASSRLSEAIRDFATAVEFNRAYAHLLAGRAIRQDVEATIAMRRAAAERR